MMKVNAATTSQPLLTEEMPRNARTFNKFRRLLSRASKEDQKFLLAVAQKMSANRERTRRQKSKV